MKRYTLIGVLLLGSALFVGCGSSNKSTSSNKLVQTNSFTKVETDIIYKYMTKMPKNVQISIAKIKDGNVHYYGALNQNSEVVTIDNHSRGFMIGSISKVFTSTLLAQLVLDGKVNLDDDIAKRLPFSLHNDIHMSYKQLANHTSGLGRLPDISEERRTHYHEDNKLDDSDMVRYLKEDLALKYLQNSFSYSNTGVAILGYMITHIENKPYDKLLQEHIFSTLSMSHSTLRRDANLVPAIMANDDPIPPMFKSAGGIISTVEDLYQFSLATFDDIPAYTLTQKTTFVINSSVKIGLGWFIVKNDKTGLGFLYHDGGTEGYTSEMFLDPENHNGIIILSNLPDEEVPNVLGSLSRELMAKFY